MKRWKLKGLKWGSELNECGSSNWTLCVLLMVPACLQATRLRLSPILGDPNPLGCRPVPARGLLGTGPHSRRRAVGTWGKLHLSLPISPRRSHYHLNKPPPTRLWKNCLPRSWSLVPKRLEATLLRHYSFENLTNLAGFNGSPLSSPGTIRSTWDSLKSIAWKSELIFLPKDVPENDWEISFGSAQPRLPGRHACLREREWAP